MIPSIPPFPEDLVHFGQLEEISRAYENIANFFRIRIPLNIGIPPRIVDPPYKNMLRPANHILIEQFL